MLKVSDSGVTPFIGDVMFSIAQLLTAFSVFSLEEHYVRLDPRAKDKFSAHDLASMGFMRPQSL